VDPPAAAPAPIVELREVSRSFGPAPAVDRLSLAIQPGEFFSLLGPSGCGKTTTLRLLAGLESPDAGEILIDGRRVNDLRPYERGLGMVFQSYALFPHLNVAANVAFGLQQRRTDRRLVPDRVRTALELVRLDPATFAARMPGELSGGQRQRVALARALVLEPRILLLDEPLGALDLKLRKEMQLELKALSRSLGITFVYVTHDQEEALTMSDRVAVMDRGRIAQLSTPADIYENPRTRFVASFIGASNFLTGLVSGRAGPPRAGQGTLEVVGRGVRFLVPGQNVAAGTEMTIAVRPEWMDLFPAGQAPPDENTISGVVEDVIFRGETIHLRVALRPEGTVMVAVRNEGQTTRPLPWVAGSAVDVAWLPEDCQVLEADP
jgi:spermidine/putrescine ABC transporter ATP-binding subunit